VRAVSTCSADAPASRHLHPLTSQELGDRFDLSHAAERGLLPSIYFSDDPRADLEAYAAGGAAAAGEVAASRIVAMLRTQLFGRRLHRGKYALGR